MNKFFHVPEGTKIIHLLTDNIDQPIVIFFQNTDQQTLLQSLLLKKNSIRSALGIAINAAFVGASSQIFPESYRQDLIEAFSNID